MNLEKAQEIKKICNRIDDIEQMIERIENCSYIDMTIINSPLYNESLSTRIHKDNRVYKHIIQSYKEDRDALIREINDM